jgi:hypothetical protein
MLSKLTEKLFFSQNIKLDKNAHVNLNLKMLIENNESQTLKFINEFFSIKEVTVV